MRGLSESTIMNYFAGFVRDGLPLHMRVLNITPGLIQTVLKSIRENGSGFIFGTYAVENIFRNAFWKRYYNTFCLALNYILVFAEIARLKPIMEQLPEGTIDYNRLKIIFALLEYEYGIIETEDSGKQEETLKDNGSAKDSQSKRSVPGWMTKNGKNNKIGPPAPKRSRSSLFR